MLPSNRKAEPILIVDDLPSTRLLMKHMLEDMGFSSIIEASSGAEALDKIKQHGVALLVCDCMMKGMNGVELVETLRKTPQHAKIPVIMVSNNRDVPDIEAAMEAGVDDYIVKPISFHLLKRRIYDLFNRNNAPLPA
jgi:two-component system chemotaxis response regulator CheY